MRLNLHRIEDATHENLLLFLRMLGVLGFKEEGRGKQYFYKDGVWADKIYFSLLAADFLLLREKRGGRILFSTHDELLSAIKNSVQVPS